MQSFSSDWKMGISCLSWVSHFWTGFTGTFAPHKNIQSLPEEVVANILSRLPADQVVEYRRVCKEWRALTSSPYLVNLHHQRQETPIIFAQFELATARGELEYYFIDEEASTNKMFKRINYTQSMRKECPLVHSSCNGLLLLTSGSEEWEFFIVNPFTCEEFNLGSLGIHSRTLHHFKFYYRSETTHLCGFYFNSETWEYCLLFYSSVGNSQYQYAIYSVKGKWRVVDSFQDSPDTSFPPAIVNGALHWLVSNFCQAPCTESIMVFNTKEEKVSTRPHPGRSYSCTPLKHMLSMRLLEMEKHLCFCHVCSRSNIDIWVLEDYSDWTWVRRYKVDLTKYVVPHSIFGFQPNTYYGARSLVNIRKNELLVFPTKGQLFRYHLQRHTIRKIHLPMQWECEPYLNTAMFSYTKSLVSLKDLL